MFNAAETIGAQMEALVRQEWSGAWEVIVADNGSDDAGRAFVEELASDDARVRLVDASGRRGPAHARNVGVAHARGVSVAFCDADDVVSDGWVAAMGDALRLVPAATGPQEQQRLNPPWLANAYGSRLGSSPQRFAAIFPFGPSSNLGVRKQVFLDLGGFDPAMKVGEDVDLCMRLWLADQELRFVPAAVVHYRNRGEVWQLWKQAVLYGSAGPAIVRRLRARSSVHPPRLGGMKNWFWLVRNIPTLRTRQGRVRWVVVAGGATGRVVGSIRHRVLYL
jgi:glycosyltransferase involved in cell wall biosynthesis